MTKTLVADGKCWTLSEDWAEPFRAHPDEPVRCRCGSKPKHVIQNALYGYLYGQALALKMHHYACNCGRAAVHRRVYHRGMVGLVGYDSKHAAVAAWNTYVNRLKGENQHAGA